MRLKASFFRFTLAVVAFLIPLAVLVTLMPAIINAEPVKKRLLQELRDWTGGDVALNGPVAIESFFSLSLRARDVGFDGATALSSLKRIEAGQLVARISWVSLFSGKLEFDKIKIDDARIVLEAMDRARVEDALRLLLTGPKRAPFTDFVLSDTRVELLAADGTAGEVFQIDHFTADLDRPRGRVSLKGEMDWQGETIEMRIKAEAKHGAGPDIGAIGTFRLTLSGTGTLVQRFGAPFAAVFQGETHLAGSFEFAGQRLGLSDAEFRSVVGQAAGDLTVTGAANGPRIEGSLAVSELDLDRFWPGPPLDERRLATLFGADSMDLRISANRTRWRGLTTGAAVFTLTGKQGRLASEIAHLDLMGGSLLGHAEADLADGLIRARTRLTAENLDSAQLVALGLQGEWLTGLADLNLEAETEGRALDELKANMKAKIHAAFPEGGRMRFDPVKLARSLSAQGLEGWDGVDLSWRDFADLRFQMSLGDAHMRFIELSLTTEAGAVKGRGEVDLGTRDLDWRLDVVPMGGEAVAQQGVEAQPDLGLSITGSWERPSIRLGRRSSRADRGETRDSRVAAPGRL
jgi:uncharacterized protein involved in outer membrane biogenesis